MSSRAEGRGSTRLYLDKPLSLRSHSGIKDKALVYAPCGYRDRLVFPSSPPGGPSPCPGHYSLALGYYAACAILPTRWHVRVLLRGKVVSDFPSSVTYDVSRSP